MTQLFPELVPESPIKTTAIMSECGAYRYALGRHWTLDESAPSVLFIALNPSTADASQDDPTVRRMMHFARDWGYERMHLANIFALRSTDPKALYRHPNPIGPANDSAILQLCELAHRVVCCWGTHGAHLNRGADVLRLIADCFGRTAGGHPPHPLYLSKSTTLVPLREEHDGGDPRTAAIPPAALRH